MSIKIEQGMVGAAVLGGAILGGGGGGWIEEGKKLASLALENGFSEILNLEDLKEKATLLTVSAVGAPSTGKEALEAEDYVQAVELFIEKTGIKIDGLISSEIGALGVVNGWIQSAFLRIPVVNAPCNGRAHPLGLMGSMGLNLKKDYVSLQTAVGGSKEKKNRIEKFFRGSISRVSKSVREAAIQAGGMVAVARNPVQANYVRENGAAGALAMALKSGKIFIENKKSKTEKTIETILDYLGGDFMIEARVQKVDLRTERGLDVGKIRLREGNKPYELTFWNEYMTLEAQGKRIATFPDLIMTFDSRTSLPLISAQIEEGREAFLITVPAKKLILGAGVRNKSLLKIIEKAIRKEILKYTE